MIESPRFTSVLARMATVALWTVVAAGSWDVWWHAVIGRDTFWEPPHILLQIAVVAALAVGLYGWVQSRASMWKRFAIAAAIVPLSAPFDELWHRAFGVESLASPFIVWSPPHLALVGAVLAALILVVPAIREDQSEVARFVFIALVFGAVLQLLSFVAIPLDPLGPFRLLGFGGAAVPAAMVAFTLVASRQVLPASGMATMTSFVSIAVSALVAGAQQEGGATPSGMPVPPHADPPMWLSIFGLLVAAAVVDTFGTRWRPGPMGAVAGVLSTGILYAFAPPFLPAAFRYGLPAAGTAIIGGLVGGFVGGLVAGRFSRRVSGG